MANWISVQVINPPVGATHTNLWIRDPLGRNGFLWRGAILSDLAGQFRLPTDRVAGALPGDVALPNTFGFYLESWNNVTLTRLATLSLSVLISGGEAYQIDMAAQSIAVIGPAAIIGLSRPRTRIFSGRYLRPRITSWNDWVGISLPRGAEIYCDILGRNLSGKALRCFIVLTLTQPDGSSFSPPHYPAGDPYPVVPHEVQFAVAFGPITFGQLGLYTGQAFLSVEEA